MSPIVPNRIFVAGVGLLLVGLAVNGVRTGVVAGRIGRVQRDSNPAWFWFRVTLYLGLGVIALFYAWMREA
jgi:hypothetical protein